MRYLSGEEEEKALEYLAKSANIAKFSTCLRAKCGSIIVKDNTIIGTGFNSPPGNLENQRRCKCSKDDYDKKVTDKTCCVHAEQRAILNALAKNSQRIIDSSLYFTRIDEWENLKVSGEPYCTICSKMALDIGISEFILFNKQGVCAYNTGEYNTLSFNFRDLR
jgi:deoxycytidylate deaminase